MVSAWISSSHGRSILTSLTAVASSALREEFAWIHSASSRVATTWTLTCRPTWTPLTSPCTTCAPTPPPMTARSSIGWPRCRGGCYCCLRRNWHSTRCSSPKAFTFPIVWGARLRAKRCRRCHNQPHLHFEESDHEGIHRILFVSWPACQGPDRRLRLPGKLQIPLPPGLGRHLERHVARHGR